MYTRTTNPVPCKTCGRAEAEHSIPFEHATLGRDCQGGYTPADPIARCYTVLDTVLPPIDLIEASAKRRVVEALGRILDFHASSLLGDLSERLAQDLYDEGVRFKDEAALKNWSPR